jgi:hypothetical protein
MGDHRIVGRISIFGDVEIFLDNTPCIREERPVGADSTPIFIRLSDIVGADCDKAAIANFELTMELTSPSACLRSLGQKPPRLRTRTIGSCPCSSESWNNLRDDPRFQDMLRRVGFLL